MKLCKTAAIVLAFVCSQIAIARGAAVSGSAAAIVTSHITSEVASKKYDYIVVGGGTAGSALARRLTEGASQAQVLLIEAGNDTRKWSNVIKVDENYGEVGQNSSINWLYETQPNQFTPTRDTRGMWAGIGLGGTTTINGGLFDLPQVDELDAWKGLGNENLNGNQILQYSKGMQDYHEPLGRAKAFGATSKPDAHGKDGPIAITFVGSIYAPAHRSIKSAIRSVFGYDQVEDTGVGAKSAGFQFNPHYILPDESSTTDKNVESKLIRASAATGYISPLEEAKGTAPRLTVLTLTRASRVIVEKQSDGSVKAVGVEAQQKEGGQIFKFTASREVVISSGVVKSPVLLELSGIGSAHVLKNLSVPQVAELPGVGANLMETNAVRVSAPVKQDVLSLQEDGPTAAFSMLAVDKIFKNASAVQSHVESQLATYAKQNVILGGAVSEKGALAQLQIQANGIFKSQWPVVEFQYFSRKGQENLDIAVNMMQVFSRGSIHATNKDAIWKKNSINITTNFFGNPIDVDFHVAGLRSARQLLRSVEVNPLLTGEEVEPGFGKVPADANYGPYTNWEQYLKSQYYPYSHAYGTCAMMSRELGGVVSSDFIVHGTSNLRVVDASVMPMRLTAHPTGIVYALAEMAAKMIIAKGA